MRGCGELRYSQGQMLAPVSVAVMRLHPSQRHMLQVLPLRSVHFVGWAIGIPNYRWSYRVAYNPLAKLRN